MEVDYGHQTIAYPHASYDSIEPMEVDYECKTIATHSIKPMEVDYGHKQLLLLMHRMAALNQWNLITTTKRRTKNKIILKTTQNIWKLMIDNLNHEIVSAKFLFRKAIA